MLRTFSIGLLSLAMGLLVGVLFAQPGSIDPTFNPGGVGADGSIRSMHVLDDGKLLIAGWFSTYNGTSCGPLARLMPNGTLDNSFQPAAINGLVHGMRVLNNGRIAIHGNFTTVGGVSRPSLAVLQSDGSLDHTFDPTALVSSVLSAQNCYLSHVEFTSDCKPLLYFSHVLYPTPAFQNMYRLLPNGSQDNSFTGITVSDGGLAALAVITIRPDDKFFISSGSMDAVNGVSKSKLVLMEADGSFATGFTNPTGLGVPSAIFILPNNKMLLGHGSTFNGPSRLLLLNPDGTTDPSFNSGGSGPDAVVRTIHKQRDGKYWITGSFISYNGLVRPRIAKLNVDGSLDPTFAPAYGQGPFTGTFESGIRTDLDRRPILFGSFDVYTTAQIPAGRIVRLISCPTGAICLPDTLLPCDPLSACNCLPITSGPLLVDAKVLLQGALVPGNPNLMHQVLRNTNLLPLTEPYSTLPGFSHVDGGGEVTTSTVLSTASAKNIVDWVYLELRDPDDNDVVLHTRSALINSIGRVVDVDGSSPVSFPAPMGSYFVVVRHRNHLGVMTAAPISLSNTPAVLDMTTSGSSVWGVQPMATAGGKWMLWSGDANADGLVKYTGAANDRDAVLQAIGGVVPTSTISGYLSTDLNLDGVVKYSGTLNDRDIVLQTIGGALPTATRVQQLP